ncbi:MAG: AAA family ATPase [Moorea sp. SIOASIH]|uniref:NB-ARC domain-containing protein n=1 Tax=Moorena sp. SIOASIH TaxID=2607817 RepID=UPI0013BB6B37|nr:NB-ARC domain-containing protein [Moorena sp. SIOASIH]NEO40758.1 AAA family ATPase [Moorena sp. SIOASIH]NEO92699.1 AAA family ATPase [Moorena sp. SIO3G5]
MIPYDFLKAIANEHGVSKAELEVVALAMEGQSTNAIAKILNISEHAVRKRLSEVYKKFPISGTGPVKLTKLQQLLVNRYQTHIETQDISSNCRSYTPISTVQSSNPKHMDWGEAPDVSVFYGRTEELRQLETWIVKDRCRLVALQGMAGIGKTTLSVKLAKQIQDQFKYVVWRSLRQAPRLEDILAELLQSLSGPLETVGYETAEGSNPLPSCQTAKERISQLIEYCRQHRCLIVLNGAESILQIGTLAGIYREGYEGYGEFIRRWGEEPHQSCLLITNQEKLSEISLQEGETSPVRSLKLEGLGEAAQYILQEKGLSGQKNWDYLIKAYRGNPLMLKLVAITIKEVFDGSVTDFLATTLFTHDVSDFIEEILDRLSDLEHKIIYTMASHKEPVILTQLQDELLEISPQELLRALASLRQRSLVEKSQGGFTLPPAVMEVTNQLIAERE